MKAFRVLATIGVAAGSLLCPGVVFGDGTTPPKVVPQDRSDRDIARDLKGVPDNIKTLILNFDQTRDSYLETQKKLMIEMRQTTTADMRKQIRDQLQDNRQAYLANLKAFRTQLKDDLAAVKAKLGHQEFNRIIDASHDAAGSTVKHSGRGR
jgi:hypothetical protein